MFYFTNQFGYLQPMALLKSLQQSGASCVWQLSWNASRKGFWETVNSRFRGGPSSFGLNFHHATSSPKIPCLGPFLPWADVKSFTGLLDTHFHWQDLLAQKTLWLLYSFHHPITSTMQSESMFTGIIIFPFLWHFNLNWVYKNKYTHLNNIDSINISKLNFFLYF